MLNEERVKLSRNKVRKISKSVPILEKIMQDGM